MHQKPKVLIGLPTMSYLHTMLVVSMLAWMGKAYQGGKYNLSVFPTFNVQPVDNARNEIVREFLKSDCTHLFFVDADTIPPSDAIEKLLALDVPIASGITPIIKPTKDGEPYRTWNCVDMNDKHIEPNTGVQKVKGCGGSCLLIRRDVLEKIPDPWFRFLYQDDNGKQAMISEDIFFTVNALGRGFQAYADTSVIARHHKGFIF